MTDYSTLTPEERLRYAYERGDAAAYYGRHNDEPHISIGSDPKNRITKLNMTPEEIREFWRGYEENPCGQKDWG